MRMVHVGVVLALCVTGAATAGCTKRDQPSSSASASRSLTSTGSSSVVTAATSTGSTNSATTSATASGGNTSSAGTPASPPADALACAAQLGLTLAGVSGAGGRSFATYDITNNGSASCQVPQPTISYLNSTGTAVGQVAQSGSTAGVNLGPKSVASFMTSDTSCAQPVAATQLVVALSGASAPLTLSGQYQVCSPEVTALTGG